MVKETKRAYVAILLKKFGIDKISENAISIAVYGSHASGGYDERSDLDILVTGDEKEVDRNLLTNIAEKIGKEIQITVLPLDKL